MKFRSCKRIFIGNINEIHILINENKSGKSQDFSKYAGAHPGPETNRNPGIPGIKPNPHRPNISNERVLATLFSYDIYDCTHKN